MADLRTQYLGLELRNPLIVSSSGLTDSVVKIKRLEEHGAGAVVVKSIFEEQIQREGYKTIIEQKGVSCPDSDFYLKFISQSDAIDNHLRLIAEAKKETTIPIIASINCISIDEWVNYARKIESAGADALEINVFFFPNDKDFRSEDYERIYSDLVLKLQALVKIPISVKIAPNFTNLLHMVDQIFYRGAKGVVLFNKFFEPDIDIETMEFKPAHLFSLATDIYRTIRWTGIISSQVEGIDIAASTGVHDGQGAVKLLLAGAKSVMTCSSLYMNGSHYIKTMLNEIEEWMDRKGYKTIDEFRGKMSYKNFKDPKIYERTQFIKYFAGIQ